MSLELNLEQIQKMKLPEYAKVFKKPMTWKKAKFVICMNDYKVGGKKGIVFIPYKKPAIAQKAFKKLKQEKIHMMNKSAFCEFNLGQDGESLELVIKKGGLSPDVLQDKANAAYKIHNWKVTVQGATQEDSGDMVGSVAPEKSASEPKSGGDQRQIITDAKDALQLVSNHIVPIIKGQEPTDETPSIVEDVSNKFTAFLDLFETVDSAMKERMGAIKFGVDQSKSLVERVGGLIGGGSSSSNSDDDNNDNSEQVNGHINEIITLGNQMKGVANNIAKKQVTADDIQLTTTVLEKIAGLQELVGGNEDGLRSDVSKRYTYVVDTVLPQIQRIKNLIDKSSPTKAGGDAPSASKAPSVVGDNVQDIVNDVNEKLAQFKAEIDHLEKEIKRAKAETPETPIGKGFLSLFS